ncbi:MAG: sensory histidine kinase AtoS [Syntrophus sp. PtaB.Bin001]|nr:MAG: sensory histidine kinase AtoS [Syntrophus sp. PtaB.Bin001]
MSTDEKLLQEKINQYDVFFQQLFDSESGSLVDETSIDIQKKQTEALREHVELLDLAEDLIVVLDMNHRILFWNRGAEKQYGWSRSEIRGENIHSLLNTTFPQSFSAIEKTLATYGKWKGNLVQFRRDGSSILVDSRWTMRCDELGKPLAILEINRDMTSRKHTDAMLQKALDEFEEACVQKRTMDFQKVNASLKDEIIERKRKEAVLKKREMQLKIKTKNLEELNAALTALLKKREEKKIEQEEKILSDVRSMVLPYVEKVKTTDIDTTQMNYLNILEANLKEITSPFLRQLTSPPLNMTPKEIQVASLIKDGKKTKEIAELMNICTGAVAFHRNRIRKKLGLNKKNVNLMSHLSSMALKK